MSDGPCNVNGIDSVRGTALLGSGTRPSVMEHGKAGSDTVVTGTALLMILNSGLMFPESPNTVRHTRWSRHVLVWLMRDERTYDEINAVREWRHRDAHLSAREWEVHCEGIVYQNEWHGEWKAFGCENLQLTEPNIHRIVTQLCSQYDSPHVVRPIRRRESTNSRVPSITA